MSDPGLGNRRSGDGGGLHPEAREQFARIIERIDGLKEDFREHKEEDNRRFTDHEIRLRKAETIIGRASGYAAAVAGAVTLGVGALMKKLGM